MNIRRIDSERKRLDIQMHTSELFEITSVIKPPANFLIFGLGNDSIFWFKLNKGGRTVFIENDKKWFDQIRKHHSFLEAYLVNFKTRCKEWKTLINHPKKLNLKLPNNILNTQWDYILVDGPTGYNDKTAGRMKSIYMASKLIKNCGDIFVHDVDREIEKEYCKKFLLEKNCISITRGRAFLNYYKITNKSGLYGFLIRYINILKARFRKIIRMLVINI